MDAQIITLALTTCKYQGERENILDYIPKGVTLASKYFWCTKCRGGSPYRQTDPEQIGCGDFVKIESYAMMLNIFFQIIMKQ